MRIKDYSGVFFILFLILIKMPNPVYAAVKVAKQLTQSLDTFISDSQALEGKEELEISYQMGRLDPRLNMKACQSEIDVTPMNQSWLKSNASFKFRCENPNWSIRLPVRLNAYELAWHTKKPLKRNHVIHKSDIYLKRVDTLKQFMGYFNQRTSPVGLKLVRTVSQDRLINPNKVTIPATVKRNDKVTIRASSSYVSIKSKGIALDSGAIGEQIRVRNLSSNRIIVARVKRRGMVEILL